MKTILSSFAAFLIVIVVEAQTVEKIPGFFESLADFPYFFTAHDTQIYFVAAGSGAIDGFNLWRYDGEGSTEAVAALNSNYSYDYDYFGMRPLIYNGNLFFSDENDMLGMYNWSDDPVQIPDTGLSKPRHLHGWGNKLFFTAESEQWGTEICMYDGANVPGLWLDLAEGTEDSDPRFLCSIGENLFFIAMDTVWIYTEAAGLQKVPESDYTQPNELTVAGDDLYILAYDGIRYTYWKYSDGITPVKMEDNVLGESYTILNTIVYKDQLYFRATTTEYFRGELYRINNDGAAEKIEVEGSEINEYYGSQPTQFHIHKDTLVYSAFSDMSRQEIFMYDGSGEAFRFPVDAVPMSIQNPENYFTINEDLYFTALDVLDGYQLNKLVIHPQALKNITACKTYDAGGQTYDLSGTYTYRVPAQNGPDSIITLNLTIIPNMEVIQNDSVLIAVQEGAEYTWLEADYLPVGEGSENPFIAPESGEYAVIINLDGCIDTSAFYEVVLWQAPETLIPVSEQIDQPVIYQNNDHLYIVVKNVMARTKIDMVTLNGKSVTTAQFSNTDTFVIQVSGIPAGLYMVIISGESGNSMAKVLIR